ncbi:MAG TPA: aminodeoxychorismate synthase component I [Dokdonella sp.]|uniref:aminodeoxychorismate synthase component I n=1 Tax=Dokdonella sp. TaxID=2291710 RepID=UPI002D8075F3|nr:aminodeoxychorismate synthase component I [Dokdonella sp.]HET9031287.1 aminodeoxychorismate synthase component I [Dokdonella sp.]
MSVTIRVLQGKHDLLALAAVCPDRYPGLLESAAHGTPSACRDVLAAFPQRTIQLDADGCVRNDAGNVLGSRFLDVLDQAWREQRDVTARHPDAPMFQGGWFLYLGYELAAEIEPRLRLSLPVDGPPVALALRCPVSVIVDHEQNQTTLIAESGFERLLDLVETDLRAAGAWRPCALQLERVEEDEPQAFLDGVAKVHDYLRAGDVFQVNLSREWRIDLAGEASAADIHAALRKSNPAPFSGLLQWQNWAISSSSPERLVQILADKVQTRPIAGTRSRDHADDDFARIEELIGHPKERAEHVMLIDLERNDLGRVCVPGSVIVDELMGVESYTHVHHIVSNVSGRLRGDVSPADVIRAVFPGGTITGCPKVRCMEIIAELEQAPRGAYTGAFGYLDNNGDLDLNILIRTLTINGPALQLRAGAGIVVDSEANFELEETRAKARGVLRAFGLET